MPPPTIGNLQRQVELLQAMGGTEPVRGYTADERAAAAGRIAEALGRAAGQLTFAAFATRKFR